MAAKTIKKRWDELTPAQQSEFKKILKFVGSKDDSLIPFHTYQLLNDIPHGFIHGGEFYKKKKLNPPVS